MIKFSSGSGPKNDELFAAIVAAVNAYIEADSAAGPTQPSKGFGAWKSMVWPVGQAAHLNSRVGWNGRDR